MTNSSWKIPLALVSVFCLCALPLRAGTLVQYYGQGNANDVDGSATADAYATVYANAASAYANGHGGVVDFEVSAYNSDSYDPNWTIPFGNPNSTDDQDQTKTLTIWGPTGTMVNPSDRTPISGSTALGALGSNAVGSSGRFAGMDLLASDFYFEMGAITGGGSNERVTQFGVTILSRNGSIFPAVDCIAEAVLRNNVTGLTRTETSSLFTVNRADGTDDTFVGWIAGTDEYIESVKILMEENHYTAVDDMAFVTTAMPDPVGTLVQDYGQGNANDVDDDATTVTHATLYANAADAYDDGMGGVVDFEVSTFNGDAYDPNWVIPYGNPDSDINIDQPKVLTIWGPRATMTDPSGRTPISGDSVMQSVGLTAIDTGGRFEGLGLASTDFHFEMGAITGGHADERVTQFGVTLLSRDQASFPAVDCVAAAVIRDYVTDTTRTEYSSTFTLNKADGTDDTFVGWIAGQDEYIESVTISMPSSAYTAVDDMAFVTDVVPRPAEPGLSGYEEIDNFESFYSSQTLDGVNGWEVCDSGGAAENNAIAIDPKASGEHVLNVYGDSEAENNVIPVLVADDTVASLYFKFYVPSGSSPDVTIGLCGDADPREGSDIGTCLRINGANVEVHDGGSSGSYYTACSIAVDTWYSILLIVDNDTDDWRAYITGGAYSPRSRLTHSGADDSFDFRAAPQDDFVSLNIRANTGHIGESLLVDELFIDPTGANGVEIPVPDGFPNDRNTGIVGAGISVIELDDRTDEHTIFVTTSGTTFEDCILEKLYIQADNVTVRNCYLKGGSPYAIDNSGNYSGLLIEDCTFVGNGGSSAIVGPYAMRRCNISGYQDGVKIKSGCVLEDSYIHALTRTDDSHNDCIQKQNGNSLVNAYVRHNTLMGPYQMGTSAIIAGPSVGETMANFYVADNLAFGGSNCMNMSNEGGAGPTNVNLLNNLYIEGSFLYNALVLGGTSHVKKANYSQFGDAMSFNDSSNPVARPIIYPNGGQYETSVQVSISCATSGATIRYTTDGSDVTSSSPVYSGAFSVTSDARVKARAFYTGMDDSHLDMAVFKVD